MKKNLMHKLIGGFLGFVLGAIVGGYLGLVVGGTFLGGKLALKISNKRAKKM